MSKIATIKALAPKTTPRPWRYGPKQPKKGLIADVVSLEDCDLLTTSVNSTDGLLALYAVAARISARLKAKKTTVLAADREALYKALAELEV